MLKSSPESYEMFKTSTETHDELPTLDLLRVKIMEYHGGHAKKHVEPAQ